MFIKVVSRVKRNLAPHLKAIMGCWLMSQNDPYAPAGSGAKVAFRKAFTLQEKQGNAVAFCQGEVLQVNIDADDYIITIFIILNEQILNFLQPSIELGRGHHVRNLMDVI